MKLQSGHAPTLEVLTQTLTVFGRLGTRLAAILRTDDHRRVTKITINPNGYGDWRDFFLDYSALNLVKKFPGLKLPGVNPRSAAIQKFRESETLCHDTNFLFAHPSQIPHDARVLLARARREIRRVLGVFSWDDTLPYLSHGPGATYRTRRVVGHPWYKFGDIKPTVTGDCLTLHSAFSKWSVLWDDFQRENAVDIDVVGGSKVTTVPKDAKIDRVIAVEPLLNMFYQKGIGGLIRSRLSKSGCDLNDQTTNQRFALVGSLGFSLATLDLSSASDTISRGLVEYLLPDDWLSALNITRSHFTEIDGERIFLQKFSSMGNGFTFELESLIFLALGRAVCSGTESVVSVYGDDIIIDSSKAHELIWLLRVCGFSTNTEKTFISGPFRESCGKHYFLGHDVTPIYVKSNIESQERYLWYLNSLKRLAHRLLGVGFGCHSKLEPIYTLVYGKLNPRMRSLSIPEGFGDGGVVRDFDEVSPTPKRLGAWVEGYSTQHVTRIFERKTRNGPQSILHSLFSLGFPKAKRWTSREVARAVLLEKSEGHLSRDSWLTLTRFTSVLDHLRPEMGSDGSLPLLKYKCRVVKLDVTRWSGLGPWVNPT